VYATPTVCPHTGLQNHDLLSGNPTDPRTNGRFQITYVSFYICIQNAGVHLLSTQIYSYNPHHNTVSPPSFRRISLKILRYTKQQINKPGSIGRSQHFWCGRRNYPYKFITQLSNAMSVYHARLYMHYFFGLNSYVTKKSTSQL
jgi:hypothetical protein